MGKLMSVAQLMQKSYVLVDGLSEGMKDAIGEIEDTFTMLVWGDSANGKTSFIMQMIKELKHLGHVLYLGYEEGHGKSFQDAVKRAGLEDAPLQILDHVTADELTKRLKRKKSPKVIIMDSWQYSEFTLKTIKT
jgi:predicted ATP-dependent serine protease